MTYTKQQVHDAIMKAAAIIESQPRRFDISCVRIPGDEECGSPACALGWISHFLRAKPSDHGYGYALSALGRIDDGQFYRRMGALCGYIVPDRVRFPSGAPLTVCAIWPDFGPWTSDAAECARLLRIYAATYHPVQQPPDWNTLAYAPKDNSVSHTVLA
jgi:hypothetical protein